MTKWDGGRFGASLVLMRVGVTGEGKSKEQRSKRRLILSQVRETELGVLRPWAWNELRGVSEFSRERVPGSISPARRNAAAATRTSLTARSNINYLVK